MYPFFIEVHDVSSGSEQLVHIDTIEGIFTEMVASDVFATHIDLVDGDCYQVQESYDEVKALIEGCGCLINKADPRLDTSHPLTKQMIMDEEMVGEPVWNSNNGRWYQIANWSNLGDEFYMEIQGVWEILKYDDNTLKAKPLYRMKQ